MLTGAPNNPPAPNLAKKPQAPRLCLGKPHDPISALRRPGVPRAGAKAAGPWAARVKRPRLPRPPGSGGPTPPPLGLRPPPGPKGAERAGVGLTAASVAVAVAIPARAPGVLHDHALAAEVLAVQLVNGVVGVAGVLELHEAVPRGRREGRGQAGRR